MKRFGRWLLRGLMILSLLLCVATVVLWVRCSGRLYRPQMLQVTGGPTGWEMECKQSSLVLLRKQQGPAVPRPATLPKGAVWVGVTYASVDMQIPYWLLASAFGTSTVLISSILAVLRSRRRKSEASGRCAKCGYDLRATPDRCPECGTVVAKTKIPT